jgi:hypothetical protein
MPTCPVLSTRTWSASEIRSWTNPRSSNYGLWGFSDFDEAADGARCVGAQIEAWFRAATRVVGEGFDRCRDGRHARICMMGWKLRCVLSARPRLFGVESGYFLTRILAWPCRITTPSSGFV